MFLLPYTVIMRLLLLLLLLLPFCYVGLRFLRHRVLIIPYQEAMPSRMQTRHFDGFRPGSRRNAKTFRLGLLKSIKERTAEISDTRLLESDFVAEDVDQDRLYKAIYYTEDTVYRKTKLLPADSTIAANTKPLSKKAPNNRNRLPI